jgi:3-dehydroquinate dehydratase-2
VPDRVKILVLHGPNLNLFGRREPHIYGMMTLAQIDERIRALAEELDVEIEIFQSSHEGALLEKLHAHGAQSRRCPFP